MRLVLLWFGTWKNTGARATRPDWVKLDNKRFPRMINARRARCITRCRPLARTTLEADKQRLRRADAASEGGRSPTYASSWSRSRTRPAATAASATIRPGAQKLFDGPVPAALVRRMGEQARHLAAGVRQATPTNISTPGTIARYVDADRRGRQGGEDAADVRQRRAARSRSAGQDPRTYSSGGPTLARDRRLEGGRAAHRCRRARHLQSRPQGLCPQYLELYARPDNPLFVPETGNAADYARYLLPGARAAAAIGFAPFGMDATGYSNYPLGAAKLDDETIEAFAAQLPPVRARWRATWAKIAFEKQDLGRRRSRPTPEAQHSR